LYCKGKPETLFIAANIECEYFLSVRFVSGARSKSKYNILYMEECCMPKKHKYLTLDERTLIQTQLQQGF
jgi:hypothetical protein